MRQRADTTPRVRPEPTSIEQVTSNFIQPRHASDFDDAMEYAIDEACNGPEVGPNPRVGCVLLAPAEPGELHRMVVAGGWHNGRGTPHAEVAALQDAKARRIPTRGLTAVVTLEPCSHHGSTPPCTEALLAAGVTEVVYAIADPGEVSGGGANYLRRQGVKVSKTTNPLVLDEARELILRWHHAVRTGRPYVTVKLATTLDGKVAAPDGTSQWITGPAARRHAHEFRSTVDAIAITTGTALIDDPALTARDEAGHLAEHQPLRVVVGRRDLPAAARLHGPGGELVHLRTHDIGQVLDFLAAREVRHLLIEGGPKLVTEALHAGVVDEIHAYVAPVLLGGGPSAIDSLGVHTLSGAPRWHTTDVHRLGEDSLMVMRTTPRTWVFDIEEEE